MCPRPGPVSVPKKRPIPWDASAPYSGLGFREIESDTDEAKLNMAEIGIKAG